MDEEPPPADLLLIAVGRYQRLSQARECGLVLAAMGMPHWIIREKPDFVLSVEMLNQETALAEIGKYEAESRQQREQRRSAVAEPPWEKLSTTSLYAAALVMSAFWFFQNYFPESWMERGQAVSGRIIHQGEWWRALTALTLHGDFSHFLANLMSGLLFSAFLVRQWGSGLSWLAIVLAGGAGNLLNAWFYADKLHISIGASTAVFGALGLRVGDELLARILSPFTRSRWQIILPIGAGLGLLAFLGTGAGDERRQTDLMAHFWGLSAGIFLGSAIMALDLKKRMPPIAHRFAAILAPLLIAFAWWLAL